MLSGQGGRRPQQLSFPPAQSIGGVLMWDSAAFATFQALWVAAVARGWKPTPSVLATFPFAAASTTPLALRIGARPRPVRNFSICEGREPCPIPRSSGLLRRSQDRISPGVRSATEKIRQFSKEGDKAARDGEKSTKLHAEAFAKLRDPVERNSRLIARLVSARFGKNRVRYQRGR
jgi:hypothetical protein